MNNITRAQYRDLVQKLSLKFKKIELETLNENKLYQLLNITSTQGVKFSEFINIYNLLNINPELNNQQYIKDISLDMYSDIDLSISTSNLNYNLISLLSYMVYDPKELKNRDLMLRFFSEIENQKSTVFLETESYIFNYEDGTELLKQNFNNSEDYLNYIKNKFILKEDGPKYNSIARLIAKQNEEDILKIIESNIKKNILPSNFLEKNYSSENSFLHNLCQKEKYNAVYDLVKNNNFPIQNNCNFLAEIRDNNTVFKFITDFKIDLYNSHNEKTIKAKEEITLTPYEAIVKSSNPYKNEILSFASKHSNKNEEELVFFAAKEFSTLVEKSIKKRDVLDYLTKNQVDLRRLEDVYKDNDKKSFLDTIKNKSFWFLYPLLTKQKAYNLTDKKGFTFLNSILTDVSSIKYQNIFDTNFSLMLTKEVIIDSNSQFRSIFLDSLNNEKDNFSKIKNPNNKSFFGGPGLNDINNIYTSYNSYAPFYVDYYLTYGNHNYKENKYLKNIYNIILEEVPYLKKDIEEINKEIEKTCINNFDRSQGAIKQLLFYYYCTHHYAEDNSPLIKYEELNLNSFLTKVSYKNENNFDEYLTLNSFKNTILLENIIISKKHFPESLGNQEEETIKIFQATLLKVFKDNNQTNSLKIRNLEDEEIKVMIEIFKMSENSNCKLKILDLPELRIEMEYFLNNNPKLKYDYKSLHYQNLKILFDNENLIYCIPLTKKTINTNLKF